MEGYDELSELQKDAKRAIEQAERLCAIKPERKASYEKQLRATLFVINGEADAVTEKMKQVA